MADIDQIIAGGAGAGTTADFSGIPKILDYYYKGKDEAAKNDLREAFKGGVPILPDGSLDISSVMKTLFQKGDIAGGVGLAGTAANAQERSMYAGGGTPPANYGPPATGRNAVAPDPSVRAPVSAAPAGIAAQGQGGETPASFLDKQGISGYNREVGLSYFKRNGIDPDQPFNPNDPAVASKLGPVLNRLKSVGQVQPPQPGDNQPQQVPQPQVAQAPQQAPQGFQPSPQQIAAQNDPTLKRLQFFAASPDKSVAESARAELKAYIESKAPTNPMKEAGASGLTLQQYQERQGEQAAQQAGATERAKNDVVEQKSYIDNGRVAQQRLGTLNTLSNIISTDKNLNLGFGSETTLKVKMALEKAGFDVGDLSGAQMIQKMNGILAAESTKSLATRPTQFEFKTFLGNNPGLALDEKGNIRMLGILSQNAKREVDLGKLARKNQDNWDNWDNVVEAYDKRNPVKDPTTGKILSSNSIISPGPSKGATPVSGSAQAAPAAFPNAKQAPDGNWYVPDPARPGKYSKVVQ